MSELSHHDLPRPEQSTDSPEPVPEVAWQALDTFLVSREGIKKTTQIRTFVDAAQDIVLAISQELRKSELSNLLPIIGNRGLATWRYDQEFIKNIVSQNIAMRRIRQIRDNLVHDGDITAARNYYPPVELCFGILLRQEYVTDSYEPDNYTWTDRALRIKRHRSNTVQQHLPERHGRPEYYRG